MNNSYTTVEPAPHECQGNLVFVGHGLSPYWASSMLLHEGFDGSTGNISAEIAGEQWTVEFRYQNGGIQPRAVDDVSADRLHEYRLDASGSGERKASWLIQPRFEGMRHYESGDQISTPFDRDGPSEGVNVRFSGSNLDLDQYATLLPRFIYEIGAEANTSIRAGYFQTIHKWSNITKYERYVRITRNMSQKVINRDGVLRRLWELCAPKKGSKAEYKVDNEEIVGKNHTLVFPKKDARRLIPGHRLGKRLKHYHPKHVRETNDGDPLYHPKVGALANKALNGCSFPWHDRQAVENELDELLVNCLRWSGVPVGPDSTTFVHDDHFQVRASERDITLYDDPTPEIEAEQEALLVRIFQNMTDADVDMVEALVTNGEGQHPKELAGKTERGISTIYRALKRLQGVVENEGASVRFGSRKIAQEIREIVQSTEHQIENAADRVAQLLNVDRQQASSSAFQKWLNEYAVEVTEIGDDGEMELRIDTLLSELKSTAKPHLESVLREGAQDWVLDGGHPEHIKDSTVTATVDGESCKRHRLGTYL